MIVRGCKLKLSLIFRRNKEEEEKGEGEEEREREEKINLLGFVGSSATGTEQTCGA